MTSPDLLTAWAQLLVRSLEELGIEHAVLSPGSRSTPLTWALTRSSRIEHRVVLDERSAAFVALGQARYSGKPSALVCTSGSAAANYFPALVEANLSHTPVLVISADRPYELQQCGAPQTIDQTKLYGDNVRAFFDLGMPDESEGALRALRRQLAQAFGLTLGPVPGPVHVNFRARKPLEPQTTPNSPLSQRIEQLTKIPLSPSAHSMSLADPAALRRLADRCREAKRGVITVGPSREPNERWAPLMRQLLQVCNFTLLCETTSQLRHGVSELPRERVCDGFDWIYASEHGARAFVPDFVLQLGNPLTSGAWQTLLGYAPQLELHVVCEHGWMDPTSRADSVVQGSLPATLTSLVQQLADNPNKQPSPWHQQLAHANRAVWGAVTGHLSECEQRATLAEGLAVHAIMNELPANALLMPGNSLPVREIDQYFPASNKPLRVLSQRGANGIDGVISGACGAAQLHSGPTLCLLGDISYLHDVGGLWAARALNEPLLIAVLDNAGGRIFEQLPLLRSVPSDAPEAAPWLTPHTLDLTRGAELFGLRSATAHNKAELLLALRDAFRHPGATVLDVRVEPSSARDSRAQLVAECERVLTAPLFAVP